MFKSGGERAVSPSFAGTEGEPMKTTDPAPATLLATHRHALHSEVIGETFQIDVALPSPWRGQGPEHQLPVVYVMDANTVFGIAAQTLRFLQTADGVPPCLLVGVGYQLEGPRRRRRDYGALRTRDLTPSFDAGFHDTLLAQRGEQPWPDIAPGGGGEAFLDFLIDELRPFIAGRYVTDPADQTLVGSSLGGLFSLHAYLTRPGAFTRHVAGSPALWWREREAFASEAAAQPDPATRLFLSVGGLETDPNWHMVDHMREMARRLTARGLPAASHVFEGESHTSVIPAALSRGLRSVFAPLPSEPIRA
ncbi:MAG: alpha/beta hydrolase-fold protein [Phenylobacterium sp.]|uniref:alpha/beta hydrolase n=1 Tax=Phenylobacterium sp. TaxID=1871053 RepID=UPI002730D93C|nr:alpha/beta hydrolase-fold protein [Phenylobacterium sp.]MDP2010975.1 alpha/beta hydrolase-fold protein [Phenylobacterium sp.]